MLKFLFLAAMVAPLVVSLVGASNAFACPQQNENFFISEFDGQENMSPGHIDTDLSVVESTHNGFVIQSVELNGIRVCSQAPRGRRCGREITLKAGPLSDDDHVLVVLRPLFPDESRKNEFVFERRSAAKNQGHFCRPIWAH